MFNDLRSKKVVFVSHCILNQNAKIDGCARYPGAMKEVCQRLLDEGVGFVQMPCPEMFILGLDRQTDPSALRTIESEDDRVAERMNDLASIEQCRQISHQIIQLMLEYQKNRFEIIGVLGINGSPTCGVETGWANGHEKQGYGVLIEALSAEIKNMGLQIPIRGIKAQNSLEAVETVNELLKDKK